MAGSSESEEKSNQLLLFIGTDEDYNTVIQMYDIDEDEWYQETTCAELKWLDAVPYKNKIYMIDEEVDVANETYGIKVHAHDFGTKDIEIHQIPTKDFAGRPIGIHKGFIYLIDRFNKRINMYNVKDHKIKENVATFSESHEKGGTAFLNGLLYIVGELYSDYDKSDCETYNTVNHEVRSIAPFPLTAENWKSRHADYATSVRISATTFDEKLYAIEENSLKFLYIYNPENDEWETIANFHPPDLNQGTLTTCGGKLVCVDRNVNIHIYNSQNNTWETRGDYDGPITHVMDVFGIEEPKFDNE